MDNYVNARAAESHDCRAKESPKHISSSEILTEHETQLSGVAISSSFNHLPDHYQHLLNTEESSILPSSYSSSHVLSKVHSEENDNSLSIRCSTPNTAPVEHENFTKYVQNVSRARRPLGDISNNSLPTKHSCLNEHTEEKSFQTHSARIDSNRNKWNSQQQNIFTNQCGVPYHVAPMVQRTMPIGRSLSHQKIPHHSSQVPVQHIRVNRDFLSTEKPATLNLKALAFLSMQYFKKHASASHRDVFEYILDCINSISSKQLFKRTKEGMSLKRRIYDAINVMLSFGMIEPDDEKLDNNNAVKFKWIGFHQFWDASEQEKQKISNLNASISKLKSKITRLEELQKIRNNNKIQGSFNYHLIPCPRYLLIAPKTKTKFYSDVSSNKIIIPRESKLISDPIEVQEIFYTYLNLSVNSTLSNMLN